VDGLKQRAKRLLGSHGYRRKGNVEIILTKLYRTAVKTEAVLFRNVNTFQSHNMAALTTGGLKLLIEHQA